MAAELSVGKGQKMCMVAGPVMHALINLQCQYAFSLTVVCFHCGLIFSAFKFKKTVMAGNVAKEKNFLLYSNFMKFQKLCLTCTCT